MAANVRYVHGEKGKDILPTYYYQSNLLHAGHERKLFLGDQASKVCRFCHRDSATSFRQSRMKIRPAALGRGRFPNFDICFCWYSSAKAGWHWRQIGLTPNPLRRPYVNLDDSVFLDHERS